VYIGGSLNLTYSFISSYKFPNLVLSGGFNFPSIPITLFEFCKLPSISANYAGSPNFANICCEFVTAQLNVSGNCNHNCISLMVPLNPTSGQLMTIFYNNTASFNIMVSIIYNPKYFIVSPAIIPIPAHGYALLNLSLIAINAAVTAPLQLLSTFDNCITRTDNFQITIGAYLLSSSSIAAIGAKQQQVFIALLSTIAVVVVIILGVYIYKKRRNNM